jgi:hypothetical protein
MGCPRRDQYSRDIGRSLILVALWLATALIGARYTFAGQAPAPASDPDVPISHRDRVYSAEQYSNTVSVTDPVDASTRVPGPYFDHWRATFAPYPSRLLILL